MRLVKAALPVIAMVACSTSAEADTVTLQQGINGYSGTEDGAIFQETAGNSAGGFPFLFVGRTQQSNARRSLIRFDLNGVIPVSATVTSVTLQLYTESGRPGILTAELHALTQAWHEGNNLQELDDLVGQGSPADPGDTTWSHVSFDTVAWTTAGGDFSSTASGGGTAGLLNTYVNLTGPGMAQDVQSWLGAPESNFGWIYIAGETGIGNAKRYYSSEGLAGKRPTLFVEYTSSGPAAAQDWELFQ